MYTHDPKAPHRRLFLGLAGACVLSLAGCAVGPDYARPAVPRADALTREPLATAGHSGPVQRQWWKAYGSPELDALVQEALERSPTIEAATATLRAARQNVIAQRGFFYPTVQLGYNRTRQNTGQSMSPALNSGETLYSYNTAQLSINYTPDIFGGNRRQVEGLMASEEGQRLQLQAARLTLASNVAGGMLQAAMLAEQAHLIEQAIAAAQEQLRHMRLQQRNGYASGLDVATQQTLLVQMQQALPPLRKELEQTSNLLATLTGRTPDQAPEVPPLSSFSQPQLPQAVASALVEQRPDVRIAETDVQQASAAIGVARAARLPQLSITAALGGGATSFARMFAAGNPTWALGAGLLQPLFAGGTLQARERAAQAEFDAAAARYRGAVLSSFQDVANALYALDIDAKAVEMAQEGEKASRSTLDLTRTQLRNGYSAQPAALAAEQSWLQARAAHVAARGALLGDTVALYQALGGGVLAKPPAD
ncbi:efflux transporter outer membrane subunit [Delftia acidovorans]|uniref:efflux transporter outer membrane subunit n=1 Tax=Delftia acidovorans TaxID=80866 RepID=UPI0035A139F1